VLKKEGELALQKNQEKQKKEKKNPDFVCSSQDCCLSTVARETIMTIERERQ
jgi:hypothetical protein